MVDGAARPVIVLVAGNAEDLPILHSCRIDAANLTEGPISLDFRHRFAFGCSIADGLGFVGIGNGRPPASRDALSLRKIFRE